MKLSRIIQLALPAVIAWTLTACGSSKATATRKPSPSLPPATALPSDAATEQQAIRFLEDKVRRDPEDFIAHNKPAGQYLQRVRETGDVTYLTLAAKAAHASLATLPAEQNNGGLTALAQVEYASHDFAGARDHALQLTQLAPGKSHPYQILGDALLELGEYERAEVAFRKMEQLGGLQGLTRVAIEQRMARLALLRGDPAEAQRHFSNALTTALALPGPPRETVAWCRWQLGETAFAIGDYVTAERHYREALTTFPDYFRALASLGRGGFGRLGRVLPVISALVITCVGVAICYEALNQTGLNLFTLISQLSVRWHSITATAEPSFVSVGALGVLGLGLVYGLKHATDVDHVVAVSTIVSEHRKLARAAIVGGLWGAGHTASLVIVGACVLALRIAIPEQVASWLEFGVALMIIGLGMAAFRRALRSRADVHIHKHGHGDLSHAHIHFHEGRRLDASRPHSHSVARIGLKPTLVGALHGLAGSGALTLLVLTQIHSSVLGLLYLAVFGLGSIIGMLLMSGLVGLPFVLGSEKLSGVHYSLQMIAGVLSITFGIWYAYVTGFASGLLGFTG